MLKSHWKIISRLERIGDNLLVVACFFLTYRLRGPFLTAASELALPLPRELLDLGPIEEYFAVLGLGLVLYNAFLPMVGAYRSMRFSSMLQLLRVSILSSGLVFLCLGSFLFLLKLDLSRSFVALFCTTSGFALFIERLAVLNLLRFFRARGKNFRNVLIVGTGAQARKLYFEVQKQPELGVRVVGFVSVSRNGGEADGASPKAAASEVYDLAARIITDAEGFEAALKKYAVDEVLFTDVISAYSTVQDLASIATEEGVQVTIVADLFSLEIFQSEMSYFGAMPLIHYHSSPGGSDNPALIIKRGMDLIISALLLVLLLPLLVTVAAAIKLETPGPVFFRQRRVGKNGRMFVLLKFRSMVQDAEARRVELEALNEMRGPVFKISNDPRVTKVGRVIRRFSIDELPQLINVLKGDMSLVGPRPPLPHEVSFYMRRQRRRLSMRPGLTCIWQVSGRNEIPDFDEWARLDLEYIDNWSLWTDLKLLMKTVPAVLSGEGAR